MRILIPGASGAIARKVAARLVADGHEVVGIDRRPWLDAPIEFHEVDVRKRAAEDVFRKAPAAGGGQHGDGHVARDAGRGALPDQPRRHARRLRLLRARTGSSTASSSDGTPSTAPGPTRRSSTRRTSRRSRSTCSRSCAISSPPTCTPATALWRFPELATTVLRLCYTLGPSGHGTLASFLRGKRVPMVLGFDPLFQFLHEDDVVRGHRRSRSRSARGASSTSRVPSRCRCRASSARPAGRRCRCPSSSSRACSGASGSRKLPRGALSHIKYPVVVDASAFREARGSQHRHDELTTVASFRVALSDGPE